MADIITRGQIVIDLVQGRVDLPKPDYDQIIKPAQQQLDITNAQNAATQQLTRTVEQQNSAYKAQVAALNEIGRRSFNEGKGDDKWQAGLQAMQKAQEAERAETERTNQMILADRARRHQRELAMLQEEESVQQQILADRARRHQENQARVEAGQRAQQQAAQQAAQDNRAVNESIQRVGEGVMKLTRSAVLLGFAQDESMQSLLKNLAMVQAGYDAFDGSRKIIQGLNAVMDQAARGGMSLAQVIGRGNIALAALAAAATAAAVAYQLLNAEEEKRKTKFANATTGVMALRTFTRSLDSPEEKAKRSQADMERFFRLADKLQDPLYLETGTKHAEAFLAAQKEITTEEQNRLQLEEQAIQKAQSQLDLAKQRLDAEKNIVRSVEAAYSKLSEGEQKRLQSAANKVKAGGDLNEYERELFERAGQGGIADSSRAKEGRAEGADKFIKSVQGLDGAATGTVGSLESLQTEFDKLTKSMQKLTGGEDAASALAKIEQRSRDIEKGFEDFQNKFIAMLKKTDQKATKTATELGQVAGEIMRGNGK